MKSEDLDADVPGASPAAFTAWVAEVLAQERAVLHRSHAELLEGMRRLPGAAEDDLPLFLSALTRGAVSSPAAAFAPLSDCSKTNTNASSINLAAPKVSQASAAARPTPTDGSRQSARSADWRPPAHRQSALARELGSSRMAIFGNLKPDAAWATSGSRLKLGRIEAFARSPLMDAVFGVAILLNAIVLVFEAQHNGTIAGAWLEFPHRDTPRTMDGMGPGATDTFNMLELIFGIIFTFELALKVACFRGEFVTDVWNWIDTVIVASWLLTITSADQTRSVVVFQPTILRLARLVRLLRLAKLVRTIKTFDSLFLMTTAMQGSLSVLFWTAALIMVILCMCAMALQTMLAPVMEDLSYSRSVRIELFKYYGSFSRALLSMFEITLGNWIVPCRVLVENVGEGWLVFFITHKMMIGFSVLGVVNGVFIQETFKVATHDNRIMMMQRKRAVEIHTRKMRRLFADADADKSGAITRDEFVQITKEPAVRNWLSSMDLDVSDANLVFSLLDDGDGLLTADELVTQASRLKGYARSIDVLHVLKRTCESEQLLAGVTEVLEQLQLRLAQVQHRLSCEECTI